MNVFYLLGAASGNALVARALLLGIFLGATLSLTGFADPDLVKNALALRDKNRMLCFLWALLLALVFCRIGIAFGWMPRISFPASFLGPSLVGGILCGAGLALGRLGPFGALASLAHGRIAALALLAGALLAVAVHQEFGERISRFLEARDIPLGQASFDRALFASADPALWAAVFVAGLLLIVFFALRKS
ncbi:MAG: YeeE/YedE family protein [Victivallaceae bacterium]|nr:YeeE/YedE family protein [Victivallaceae bacterium]